MPNIAPLVPAPREQYLRQNEARILNAALPQHSGGDPAVARLLNAALFAEDLHDSHQTASEAWAARGTKHRAVMHEELAKKAGQLKLLVLDQLAHLTV